MPPISWNEIRHRAILFSKEWAGETREDAEGKTFWDEFFDVFGIRRRVVASFEEPVKNISGDYSYIDLFWKGILLVEHKSLGKSLDKAESQAFSYIQDLARDGRTDEIPQYVMLSDFDRVALYDLEPEGSDCAGRANFQGLRKLEFHLKDFHKNIHAFAFIPGYKQHSFESQAPINLKATEILGNLHDALETGGYKGHELERFLVRILFCLFAEDTGIFERETFRLFIKNRTAKDGTDLGVHLAQLFEVLNTPIENRQKNLDESLTAFPYVNGGLFSEHLSFADFNTEMREALFLCTHFDWSQISPAIFGSLFQSVMEPKARRQMGAHYTSERDILKVIRALFLDDLKAEFERVKKNKPELKRFQQKLSTLTFFDPACGCGNFLVIAYRELRLLEIELLKELYGKEQQIIDFTRLSLIDVDAFYGIELSEWPVRIAEVAMWLMDHQMNLLLGETFGQYFARLPLKKSPTIICCNALRMDWKTVLSPDKCSYILGNPPFVGAKFQTNEQRADMDLVASAAKNSGLLDYVTGWYFKAAEYIKGTRIIVGFVSTNSITQGEQVGVLWNALFEHYEIKILFGYRSFYWESEARGKAHVHVVIMGFSAFDMPGKKIYESNSDNDSVIVVPAKNISPYLVEGKDMAPINRSKPICNVPEICFGNQPIDGGYLLLDAVEKDRLINLYPQSKEFIRRFLGSQEFINGEKRWCLWLEKVSPAELNSMPEILRHLDDVRGFRLKSIRPATRKLAETPGKFAFISHPKNEYLLIPSVSSEKRHYIPIGFMPPDVIASNLCLIIPDANLYHFGVLSSTMHMAWVRQVCGRLESRYRYSNKLVYNNYPWPETPSDKQRKAVENTAQSVLDARKEFPDATLADLYNPLTMPPKLVKAHAALDRAVDLCYRPQPFPTERQRVEFLFTLYEKISKPLLATTKKKTKKPEARSTLQDLE
ncbi:MAG TPA: SAM-dependent methyltransferase [Elusimicrobia bacterium]|nr:SAM-dependent methyltransferase [Elusimicrobiota bacterium]